MRADGTVVVDIQVQLFVSILNHIDRYLATDRGAELLDYSYYYLSVFVSKDTCTTKLGLMH